MHGELVRMWLKIEPSLALESILEVAVERVFPVWQRDSKVSEKAAE